MQNPQGLHAFCESKRRARLLACQPCVSCTEPLGTIAEMKKLLIIAFNIFFAAAQSSVNSDARMIWDRVVNNIVKHDLEALSNHIHFPLKTYLKDVTNKEVLAEIFDEIFTTNFIKALGKTSFKDIVAIESDNGEIRHTLSVYSSVFVDGFEVESMLYLEFMKIDGEFRITQIMMAG
jgi:hypothetical protein